MSINNTHHSIEQNSTIFSLVLFWVNKKILKSNNRGIKLRCSMDNIIKFWVVLVALNLPLVLCRGPPENGTEIAADIYKNPENMTPLQKHVAFFDRNKDGLIYPSETYQGFRAIGASVLLSTTASAFINGFLGPKTLPAGKWQSPLFPIYVENIKKAKHGGDSGIYDSEGMFVSEKFEAIFENHAKTKPDALTSKELDDLLQANKDPKDTKGSFAGQTEWKVLYSLCKDKDGFLYKDTVRGVFDGTLFTQMEQGKACSQNKS